MIRRHAGAYEANKSQGLGLCGPVMGLDDIQEGWHEGEEEVEDAWMTTASGVGAHIEHPCGCVKGTQNDVVLSTNRGRFP